MAIDRSSDSAAAERMRRAAIEAFAESGYGGSSTRQIAKRLNMSATAMYPHYRSKEELLFAIALEGHSSVLAALKQADPLTTTFGERLRAVVAAFARWHAENHKQARVVQYELHGLTAAHYRKIAPLRHEATAVLTDIIAGGIRAGEFGVDSVDEIVMAISSLCVDVCRWFPSKKHHDAVKLGELYADIAERLVR
ncbi:TetR/AcrR family transcriptional regulator [Mycolicibacterium sp. 120266]|uniref:TetR/AcrR family transcriptional regulator n=1 Tax=Mycolicibacterium sp. 120266 TaxID=3090601 RepID=UPI00299D3CF8|nr:TetR/AcrR family transcriptional regulator [Mycolicibacterium sp. 120266]MDX1874044.1 TetR/AcrR family transcriptional regulator [Mycolicibacterium sp. 120266]